MYVNVVTFILISFLNFHYYGCRNYPAVGKHARGKLYSTFSLFYSILRFLSMRGFMSFSVFHTEIKVISMQKNLLLMIMCFSHYVNTLHGGKMDFSLLYNFNTYYVNVISCVVEL